MPGFICTVILRLKGVLENASNLKTVNVLCASSSVVVAPIVKFCSYFAFTTKISTSISASRRSILAGCVLLEL